MAVYGVSGYQQGVASSLTARKLVKLRRQIKIITSRVGGGSNYPLRLWDGFQWQVVSVVTVFRDIE